MADEVDAGNALQGDPTDIVIEAGEVVTPAPEVAEVENVDSVVENAPEPPVKEHGNKGKTPWYMERINEETNKRRATEERLAQKEREAEEARSLLERLQSGDKTPAKQVPVTDIEARAEALAAQKVLYRESQEVRSAGIREYSDFGESLKVLTSVGATGDDFVQDLIDTDKANAHKLIDFLAKDPDRALELVNMPSRRRVAELTRISMAELNKTAPVVETKKPAAVSKVPAPRPVVDASRAPEDKPEDELSDVEWSAWRKKQMAKAS